MNKILSCKIDPTIKKTPKPSIINYDWDYEKFIFILDLVLKDFEKIKLEIEKHFIVFMKQENKRFFLNVFHETKISPKSKRVTFFFHHILEMRHITTIYDRSLHWGETKNEGFILIFDTSYKRIIDAIKKLKKLKKIFVTLFLQNKAKKFNQILSLDLDKTNKLFEMYYSIDGKQKRNKGLLEKALNSLIWYKKVEIRNTILSDAFNSLNKKEYLIMSFIDDDKNEIENEIKQFSCSEFISSKKIQLNDLSTNAILKSIMINEFNETIKKYSPTYLFVEKTNNEVKKIKLERNTIPFSLLKIDSKKIEEKVKRELSKDEKEIKGTLGVMDSGFLDEKKYNQRIKYFKHPKVDDSDKSHTSHGEYVCSTALLGHVVNDWLEDKCGSINIEYHNIADKNTKLDSLLKNIEDVLQKNHVQGKPKIKIWNLSLSSDVEANLKRRISWSGRSIDELSKKYNVLFIIASGNDDEKTRNKIMYELSDSIRSITVSSVSKDNAPVSYHRNGSPTYVSRKPDLAYYGGDEKEKLNIFLGFNNIVQSEGTSLAAPLVARKALFVSKIFNTENSEKIRLVLIHESFLNVFTKNFNYERQKIGFGILPISAENLVSKPNNVISFLFSGKIEKNFSKKEIRRIPLLFDNDNKKNLYSCVVTILQSTKNLNYFFGVELMRQSINCSLKWVSQETLEVKKDFSTSNKWTFDSEGKYVYEKNLIKDYGKWQPTNIYSKKVINGNDIEGLNLSLMLNKVKRFYEFEEEKLDEPLEINVFLTFIHQNKNLGKNYYKSFKESLELQYGVRNIIEIPNIHEYDMTIDNILDITS